MTAIHSVRLSSGRTIGPGSPCFLVAEMGNNHQGDPAIAMDMVHAAAEAGADAVKFQKRDMDCLFTREGRRAPYDTPHSFGLTYGEHRQALELSITDMARLKREAESLGLVFFASSWDWKSLDQMEGLGVELHKICSADLVSIPLLRRAASLNKPLILSTGMSTWPDVDGAVAELRRCHDQIILLLCNSSYPCPEVDIHLGLMKELAIRHSLPTGYSGHERGIGPSVAAAALGACAIERHFTLDTGLKGTDHQASLTPESFRTLATLVREAEAACLPGTKAVSPSEQASAAKLRKSIVFSRDLPAGHVLTESDLAAKCPGTGVSPLAWDEVPGTVLLASVRMDEQFSWDKVSRERTGMAAGAYS